MKRLSLFFRQPDIVDVHDVRDILRRPWFKSPRLWTLLAITFVATSMASWWTYSVFLKPSRDQQLVDEAIVFWDASPANAKASQVLKGWPDERRLIELAEEFRDKDSGIATAQGMKASRAALELAIYRGSREARLELGKALRDGVFSAKDADAAVSQFQTVLKELQPGITSGDQDALYVYSLMLKDGLGVEQDEKKARAILMRVALSRDFATMGRIGMSSLFGDDRDLELAKAITRKLIEIGIAERYSIGTLACYYEFKGPPDEWDQLVGKREDEAQLLIAKVQSQREKMQRCELEFVRLAAEKGDKDAIIELAKMTDAHDNGGAPTGIAQSKNTQPSTVNQTNRPQPTDTGTPIGKPWEEFVTPQNNRPKPTVIATVDPESQNHTGYLNGTKQLAKGGLSTFKVDNTKGGGDAVVRLYLGGRKPAARNMFVKNGESFTANGVAPGDYRLRYRYIGTTDTFEANETFTLSETPTENGTRFSRVTVTLYKVANGNMTVKKVDASEF